jgi:hypothetical protein
MLALSIRGDISRNDHCGTTISGSAASCSAMRASKPEAGASPFSLACMPMVPPVYSTITWRAGAWFLRLMPVSLD